MNQDYFFLNKFCSVKTIFQTFIFFTLTYSYAALSQTDDAVLNPNQISGTILFTNQDPFIVELMETQEGIRQARIYANSQGLAQTLNNRTTLNMANTTEFDYQMTVESSTAGIPYNWFARLRVGRSYYNIPSQVTAPVLPEPAADTRLDISHCAAIVDVKYVDENGEPVTVKGGAMKAWQVTENSKYLQTQDYGTSASFSQDYMPINGDGSDYLFQTIYNIGSDIYSDTIRNMCQFTFTAQCDEVIPVECVVSERQDLGSITGSVSMEGHALIDTTLTRLIAYLGPFDNYRYDKVEGSGIYTMENLVASNAVEPEAHYIMFGHIGFGSDYSYQYLRTPIVYASVVAGEATDLGDTFDLVPGYIEGNISLVGPDNEDSGLQYLSRDADFDSNDDGIPDNVFINRSHIAAIGSSLYVPGETQNSYSSLGRSIFSGSYDSETSIFNGEYSLALSGASGAPSYWRTYGLFLTFDNTTTRESNDEVYHNSKIQIVDNLNLSRQVNPGETQQAHHDYCLNDVTLNYHSLASDFYTPNMRARGSYQGEDYKGNIVDYSASVTFAKGLPDAANTASDTGLVSITLPQGTYSVTPTVTSVNPDGSVTDTELPQITLDMGCGQVIQAATDVQVSVVDVPQTTEEDHIIIQGSVSTGANVTFIDYVKNENEPVITCDASCAPEGQFSVEVPLDEGNNSITVTAHIDTGSSASVSITIESSPPPPLQAIVLTQCNDIQVIASDSVSTAVSFDPIATGGCSTPQISCDRESSSLFLVGNTKVSCSAADTCEQSVQCEFYINVVEPSATEPEEETDEDETPVIIEDNVVTPEPVTEPTEEDADVEEPVTQVCENNTTHPVISASNSTGVLWSANFSQIPVGYVVTLNHCDDRYLSQSLVTEVYSDEEEIPGVGESPTHFSADATVHTQGLALRAERNESGDGRVYLMISRVTDSDGQEFTSCSSVVVPHDQNQESLSNALDQAVSARGFCMKNGEAPANFYQQGTSEKLEPSQSVIIQANDAQQAYETQLEGQSEIVLAAAASEDEMQAYYNEGQDIITELMEQSQDSQRIIEEIEDDSDEVLSEVQEEQRAEAENASQSDPHSDDEGGGGSSSGLMLFMALLLGIARHCSGNKKS